MLLEKEVLEILWEKVNKNDLDKEITNLKEFIESKKLEFDIINSLLVDDMFYEIIKIEEIEDYENVYNDIVVILKIVDKQNNKTAFIEFSEYNNSWSKSHFNNYKLVKPIQKNVTRYVSLD